MKSEEARDLDLFAERLAGLMPRMVRGMMRQERNLVARGVINFPQLWILQVLHERGDQPMREIAQALGVKGSTLTGLMDRLVAMRLLVRRPDPEDRRRVMARITARGRGFLQTFYREKRASAKRLFAEVPARERTVYLRVLERVADVVEREEDL